jgi:two-component system CheB/CheR fusion protein
VVIDDVNAEEVSEPERAAFAKKELAAAVGVPLVRAGRLTSAFIVHQSTPRRWRAEEVALIRETAERTWTAVERARAEERLRESEERLRLIIENARQFAIFSMDLDRRVTSWSTGAQAILGYSREEILGQSADVIFTPEDRADGAPERESARALAEDRSSDERWHVCKEGRRFWGSGVMTAMRNADGEAIGFVKIFRDHTEQRRAKQALEQSLAETQQARADAEAAGRAKDHFLAVLSHELRTPLTPVLLAADLMARGNPSEVTREAVEMIRRNIEIESRFIRDLLDVTRIGHGKFHITPAPTDLHEVIERALTIVRPDISEKMQELTVMLEAKETTVSGDAARLLQVTWNLLKNASKFTPEEGCIGVRTFNEEDQIVFEVADSGIGIDASELPLIFDAFAQANQTISQQFGGLGLGLAITKAIVEGHGGEVRASSGGRGQGASFAVRLPLLRKRDEQEPV